MSELHMLEGVLIVIELILIPIVQLSHIKSLSAYVVYQLTDIRRHTMIMISWLVSQDGALTLSRKKQLVRRVPRIKLVDMQMAFPTENRLTSPLNSF